MSTEPNADAVAEAQLIWANEKRERWLDGQPLSLHTLNDCRRIFRLHGLEWWLA